MKIITALLGFCLFLAAHNVFSAAAADSRTSFNCGMAQSRIEKFMCTSPEAGDVDGYDKTMGHLYRYLSKVSNKQQLALLKSSQVAWLKERDIAQSRLAMTMTSCLSA
jgi:uncharacterized protein YecT (DUF1311 family)